MVITPLSCNTYGKRNLSEEKYCGYQCHSKKGALSLLVVYLHADTQIHTISKKLKYHQRQIDEKSPLSIHFIAKFSESSIRFSAYLNMSYCLVCYPYSFLIYIVSLLQIVWVDFIA